jgi:hypothetical protein
MPTAFKFPEAIARGSLDGYGGLLLRKKSKLTRPQFTPSDLMDLDVKPITTRAPHLTRVTKMNEETVANGLFKAEHHDLYQGKQKGKLVEGGSGPGVLPESWNPVEKSKYDPVVGGDAFQDSGHSQEQNNMRDKKTPDWGSQWDYKKDSKSWLNPNQPNPFPVSESHRIAFPARSKKTFDVSQPTKISFKG